MGCRTPPACHGAGGGYVEHKDRWRSSITWFVKIENMEKCRQEADERGVVDHSSWLGLVSATLYINCGKSQQQCLAGLMWCYL